MGLNAAELRRYTYFSSLSFQALEELAGNMGAVSFPEGAVIIREGMAGDAFYFVKEGRLAVTKTTASGMEAKLSVIGSGEGFGEMALLTCSVRNCTIRALTPVTLYRLPKAAFEEAVLRESAFRNMLRRKADGFARYNDLKTLQPFALLEPDRMYILLSRMTEKTYAFGEDIIVQGEKGDSYFIVKSGLVAVLKKAKDEPSPRMAAILAEGDGFGEEALIRDELRNATCRAMEMTTVYVLDKADFNQIMKTSFLDNIFAEDINMNGYRENYVMIDTRVPAEYDEEHIEGALNVPVEALRQKYQEFDPRKEYITYCTNDARGMVAAFLLKSHGYKAKCLRGGISSWTGPVVTESNGVHMPA